MSDVSLCGQISGLCSSLRLSLGEKDVASWVLTGNRSEDDLLVLRSFLSAAKSKQDSNSVTALKKLSRLPQRRPLLFSNFDTSALNRKQAECVQSLSTLSFIEAKRNIIMIGPPGTGKTHLAQAIGNACCERKMKTYFIKMGELREKLDEALKFGTSGRLVSALTKCACLIIDEVGYCKLNMAESRLFFQLVDRMDAKQYGSLVLTSNKEMPQWTECFDDLDALECTLDRLCDNAYVITFSGTSYRGKGKKDVELNSGNN